MSVETCSIQAYLLSPSTAACLCAFFTFSYVGSLYLAKAGRLSFEAPPVNVPNGQERVRVANEQWRNDPKVIQARLTAAVISTVTSCLVVFVVVSSKEDCEFAQHAKFIQGARALGFTSSADIRQQAFSHLLVPVLYVGPLYVMYLSGSLPLQRNWDYDRDVREKFTSWQGLRNFWIAPITEEIVFRSCVISSMKMASRNFYVMVFAGPLWFGVAHLHHAWELYNIYGRTKSAMQRAVLTCAFQLSYTTVFGWFTTFLFLRTGSIYPSITVHVFCNIMGLPSPGYESRVHPTRKISIWILYTVGIVAFAVALGPWTR